MARKISDAGQLHINARENVVLIFGLTARAVDEAQARVLWPVPFERALVLRAVLAAPLRGDFIITATEQRIELTVIDRQRRRRRLLPLCQLFAAWHADVEFLRLPRSQALFDLFGKARRVGGGAIGFGRQDARGLMMAMPIQRRARPRRNDHQRPEGADDAHHVCEHRLTIPFGERLLRRLAEAEIEGAGEELLRAIDTSGGLEFFGADDAEGFV